MEITVTEKSEHLSLYDYLGRPAGPALGYAVATYAQKLKEVVKQKTIPHYNKPINTYRPSFLIAAFNDKNLKAIIDEDVKLYNERKKKQLKK